MRVLGCFLALAGLLAAPELRAEVVYPDFLKTQNPESLGLIVFVDDDCSVSEEEAREVARGVLIRSRIKPEMDPERHNPLFLNVRVDCVPTSANTLFSVQLRFGRWSLEFDGPIFGVSDYGALGLGPKDYKLDTVKDAVEKAVTDYLIVNFDLSGE